MYSSLGMSNGAFMSYRLACESMPGLVGIVAVSRARPTPTRDSMRLGPPRVSAAYSWQQTTKPCGLKAGPTPISAREATLPQGDVIQRWATTRGLRPVRLGDAVQSRYRCGGERQGDCLSLATAQDAGTTWSLSSGRWNHPLIFPRLSEDFGELILDWLFRGPDQG